MSELHADYMQLFKELVRAEGRTGLNETDMAELEKRIQTKPEQALREQMQRMTRRIYLLDKAVEASIKQICELKPARKYSKYYKEGFCGQTAVLPEDINPDAIRRAGGNISNSVLRMSISEDFKGKTYADVMAEGVNVLGRDDDDIYSTDIYSKTRAAVERFRRTATGWVGR